MSADGVLARGPGASSVRIVFVPIHQLKQWFPTSGRNPNKGRGESDVWSREGFLDNSTTMKKIKFVLKFEKNDAEKVIIESVFIKLFLDCFVYLILSPKYWV
jgi:hypothetical protein